MSFVPGLGYLEKYRQLIDKSQSSGLSQAELTLVLISLIQRNSTVWKSERAFRRFVKKWLVEYKFKNWKVTETRKEK